MYILTDVRDDRFGTMTFVLVLTQTARQYMLHRDVNLFVRQRRDR